MKKLFLALALAAPLTAGIAFAQPPRDGGPPEAFGRRGHHGHHRDPAAHAEHRARMLTAILDLDAHQSSEVHRILLRTATEMQTLMRGERNDQTRASMRALHDRAKAEIDALLNPTQRATMDRMEAAREQRGARGRRGGGGRGQAPRAQGAGF